MSYQEDKELCASLFADTIRETHRNKLAEEVIHSAAPTNNHPEYRKPNKTYYAGEGRRHGRCG